MKFLTSLTIRNIELNQNNSLKLSVKKTPMSTKAISQIFLTLLGFTLSSQVLGQTVLPFIEDFEKIDQKEFLQSTAIIKGAPEWELSIQDSGRVRTYVSDDMTIGGKQSLTLDSRSRQEGITHFTLTLDLSAYETSKLMLYFEYNAHTFRGSNPAENKVEIRGDDQSNWIQICDWKREASRFQLDQKTYRIDEILSRWGQKPGKTFQLRLGAKTSNIADGLTRFDGVTFDNIMIRKVFSQNAEATGINTICKGLSPLETTIENLGGKTINHAVIDWWVDGVPQKSFEWKNVNLLPQESKSVTFGSYNFSQGQHLIEVLVDSLNNGLDSTRNDTLVVTKSTGMSGVYTVNKVNGDFLDLQSAFDALEAAGTCGKVTLQLAEETYMGPFNATNIVGANGGEILIEGVDSSKTVITNQSPDPALSTLHIENTPSLSIVDCKFYSENTRNSLLTVENMYGNVDINRCSFGFKNPGSTFVALGPNIYTFASISFRNSSVADAFNSGVRFVGTATEPHQYVMENNVFGNRVSISTDVPVILEDNIFKEYTSVFSSNVVDFNRNRATGGVVIRATGSQKKSSSVANNMVYGENRSVLSIQTSEYINVYHNTIASDQPLSIYDCNHFDVSNNILVGSNEPALILANSDPFATMVSKFDHNILYSSGNALINFDGVPHTSILTWQKASPFTIGDHFELKPDFVSTNDLHIANGQKLPRGSYIGVSEDIDGDSRCLYAPSIGADEFDDHPDIKMSFSVPETVFVNTSVLLQDTMKNYSYQSYWLNVNHQAVDSLKNPSFTYTFQKTGLQRVTLVGRTCSKLDSSVHQVLVQDFSSKPQVDFEPASITVNINESVTFENLTKNGATEYSWKISPRWYTDENEVRQPTFAYTQSTDSTAEHPIVEFRVQGTYAICLVATNSIGNDSKCHSASVKVRSTYNMCSVEKASSEPYGQLTDRLGTNRDIFGFEDCGFLITSCQPQIVLYLNAFDICDNGDCLLQIYKGDSDTTGIPVHNYLPKFRNGLWGSKDQTGFLDSLVIDSGRVYIRQLVTADFGTAGPGFDIFWETRGKSSDAPTSVDFAIPDTLCTETPLWIIPQVTGDNLSYTWTIEGKNTSPIESPTPILSEELFFADDYTVSLKVANCTDTSITKKQLVVVEPNKPPTAKIGVSDPNPTVKTTVQLIDSSYISSYSCGQVTRWEITPNSYILENGTLSSSVLDVSFQDTICYDIKLVSRNVFGPDSVLGICAVEVLGPPISTPTLRNGARLIIKPNPATGHVLVTTASSKEPTEITVYTLEGKSVLRTTVSGTARLETNNLERGVNIIHGISLTGHRYTAKLVLR